MVAPMPQRTGGVTGEHRRRPSSRRGSRPGGFTLVEMLMVIAILGVLMSLLLPAIQRARERARQTQCLSRIRQLGVALTTHESQHGYYPPPTYDFPRDYCGTTRLLPYLDEVPIYDSINFANYQYDQALHEQGRKEEMAYFSRLRVSSFICPSDPRSFAHDFGGTNYRMNLGTHPTFGRAIGPPHSYERGGDGFFHARRPRTFRAVAAEVRDGLSNTVAFAERLVGDGDTSYYTPAADYYTIGVVAPLTREVVLAECRSVSGPLPTHDSRVGYSWLYAGWHNTWYNHVSSPNAPVPDCGKPIYGVVSARSMHYGGVNVAFGDGHATFISENIELVAWRAIATRANGEAVSTDAF